ncbi:MAG: hypothetical protein C4527_06490 [Candidatus Omnitrophota bacterium]|jgi:hypothetical protein|nr:MAG: hypothetical protein C4527_06490 [Candidatus Omnitrophota bacterium]
MKRYHHLFSFFASFTFSLCLIFACNGAVTAQPLQQIDGGLFYFPPTQSLLTIGGWGPEDWSPLSTVWSLAANGWSAFPDIPAGITHTTAAYDPINQRLIAIGGVMPDQSTWAFDGAAWSKLADPIVTDIFGGDPEIIFDPALGQFVMYYSHYPFLPDAPPGTTYFWEENGWVKQDITPAPPAAVDVAFVYDDTRAEGVWFSGNETWTWKNGAWIQKNPSASPAFDFGEFNMVYDAARSQCLLYGKGETWTWDGANWTKQSPAVSPETPERGFFAMGFDAHRHVVVLFGGELILDPATYETAYLDDIWEWNGSTWRPFSETSVAEWMNY